MKPSHKRRTDRHALLRELPSALVPAVKPLSRAKAVKALAKAEKAQDWRAWGKKLTKVFNRYIRLRDTPHEDFEDRYGSCFSCGRPFYFGQLDAGHFIGSQHLGTKWCEKNVHAQCRKCNRFEEGQKVDYAESLKKKYGKDILDWLEVQKKMFAKHPDVFVIQGRIKEYTAKCKAIEG